MTDSERMKVEKIVNQLALPESDRAELVRIVERLASPEAREAMVKFKQQAEALWEAVVKKWSGGERDG